MQASTGKTMKWSYLSSLSSTMDRAVPNRQPTINELVSAAGTDAKEMEVKEKDQVNGVVDVMKLLASPKRGPKMVEEMRNVREAM